MTERRRSGAELFIALHLWALGFVGSHYALQALGPFSLTVLRFLLTFGVGLIAIVVFQIRTNHLFTFKRSCSSGLVLGISFILIFVGLRGSSVANTTFITTLYVVIVPILEFLPLRRPPSGRLLAALIVSLFGAVLLTRVGTTSFNPADGFTLAGALFSAVHIMLITQAVRTPISSFAFNVYQSLWAGAIALPFAWATETPTLPFSSSVWAWIVFLVLGVNLCAFFIQIRAQHHFSPTTVSLIFLMEAPLAAGYAYALLDQTMTPLQWMGAGLILVSALTTVLQAVNFGGPSANLA